ncbi:MAG: hypothetical protein VR64_06080 [Desulfatitalea sp. BRH_c12]|nr:MAG: hypothetical protein VR64_06080 [Desulfatitalea sp. BRH_c12]
MKRSLHIGINDYPGTNSDLSGCVNDANDWLAALDARGFQTTLLVDGQATKSKMQETIATLIGETGRDDIGVITFSGHGTWVPDDNSDEPDGRDEALCPYDINEGHVLIDDELYELFCERKRGARIILISDSCHSGTVTRMADILPGTRTRSGLAQKIRFLAPEIFLKGDKERLVRARQVENMRAHAKIRAAAVLMAGCKDNEYSYDANFNGRPNGAFTFVALKALEQLPVNATYKEWLQKIRQSLPHVQYPQTPQLSGSYEQRCKWLVFSE